MLPIQELVDMSRRLDAQGRCALVDQAAAAWGVSEATFVRSSASHVFVARDLVLRLRPAVAGPQETLTRAALAAERLAAVGAPVARSRRSLAGRAVEQVGGQAVMAVEHLLGTVYDEQDPDLVGVAGRWGACVAGLHDRGLHADLSGLPHAVDLLTDGSTFAGVGVEAAQLLAQATRATSAALEQLPMDPGVFGVLHGDPEIDNLVFTSGGPVLIDLDDARRGWFASDVAFALRAWARLGAAADLSTGLPPVFLRGYRTVRPLTDEEIGWMPLLIRAAELETLADLVRIVGPKADPAWPDWAVALDARVRRRVDGLSAALIRPGGAG